VKNTDDMMEFLRTV